MLTKRDIEAIKRLSLPSQRAAAQAFAAEGLRLVLDMLGALPCALVVLTEEHYPLLKERIERLPHAYRPQRIEVVPASFGFERISQQRTPQPILATFRIPHHELSAVHSHPSLALMLDTVQDPGNVGTIIRTADWFGVQHILLTSGCADPFAPKVVQSTMGALARVKLHKLGDDGTGFLDQYRGSVLGALLDGESIYTAALDSPARGAGRLLVMGNEGNGISPAIEARLTHRLTIPSLARRGAGAESLNVAIAAAICLSELARRTALH